MNSMAIDSASMKWAMILGVLATGVLGCQAPPTLDPFMARAVVAPPTTGSFAPPIGTTPRYYNPNPPATPSPGPAVSSGVVGPANTILTASALGNAAASSVQQASAETSVLVGPTAPVAAAPSSTLAEAPLRIVENETSLASTAAIRAAGSPQSFGPGEPARFQPAGTIVSLNTKTAAESSPPDESPAAGGGVSDESEVLPDSGALNWKPTR